MSLHAPPHRYTFEEYLRMEEVSEEKHDFHDGELLAMAGGTYEHSTITANVGRRLGNALDGGPCRALESNMRVGIAGRSRCVYPDVPIVCGPPAFDPRGGPRRTILNPRVVVEVLSDSTEAYDRGRKFSFYRDVPSLEEYVLVSQREPLVETYLRQPDGGWTFATFRGLDAALKLRSLDVSIPLRDLYDGVVFPPADDDDDGPAAGADHPGGDGAVTP